MGALKKARAAFAAASAVFLDHPGNLNLKAVRQASDALHRAHVDSVVRKRAYRTVA